MRKRLRTVLQYVFFFGLGIFLVWWSIRDLTAADRSHIRSALQTARYYLIVPVFTILFLSHYIRALRWKLLIDSLGYSPSRTNTFFAVMIGYLANQAVPRLGEVLKCTVLARYEKLPADKLIGTIILERLIDGLTLLLVFAITIAIQPGIYSDLVSTFFYSSPEEPQGKNSSGLIFALVLVAAIILVVAAWMIRKKKTWADLFAAIRKIIHRVWQGISAVQHLKKRTAFVALTVGIWACYLVAGYIGFIALKETQHYGIREAFSVLSAGSIGMIVTPGGIGAYALLLEKTMMVYGLQKGIALAFGWILWLVQTAVILLGGLISFVALPWYNKIRPRPTSYETS
ncbi:MAG TPA: lysylphosphatidylglycerol synthase transmembrane domain-containing protein [Chitinophagaceae bacterium]|nr:lysylphosphatidylglycerol synthase transmembrane domain-containing protein [Chitinophagaceae bacterium]